MEQLVRSVPDVFVWADAEIGLEFGPEFLPDQTVQPVSANEQIESGSQRIDIHDFLLKTDRHAELLASPLQNLEQPKTRNAGKAVAMNRNLLAAMNYINVIPGFKAARDFRVRWFIRYAQIAERLAGKHHAPAKRIVRPVAFMDGDVMRGIGLLHQDREVHPGRAAADDFDFHERSLSKAAPNLSTPVLNNSGSAHMPMRKC